jgi:signal transduction histidine kinase
MDLLLQIGVESDLLRSHNKRWYRMEECKSETTDERTLTDACLDAERAASDANKVATTAAARQVLDDHIERDRRLADAKLLKFRVGVDRTLSRERSDYPSTNSSVAHERDSAEQRKQIERDVTDALVQQERERFDVADEARRKGQDALRDGLEARRQDTDDQLSIERQGADTSASALTEAQKKEARQREVLGVVAHDLRSPLTAICLSAENIAEATNEPLTRSTARVIELAAVRMERLISDLLDMARIESGPLRISKQRHDVGALLLEVLQSYESTFAARGITFAVDTMTDGVEAFFDYDRIVQVLSNLLGNAMKFTQSGGTVALHVERQAEMVVFIVHDNGPGIAQSALPHIFERFWTIDSDVRRGLGLGLYICQNIIQAHGGRIEAASEPNAGATFRFSLPTTQCS